MKRFLPFILLFNFLIFTVSYSQGNPTPLPNTDGISFSYDSAGNQKSCDWVCISCKSNSITQQERDSVIAAVDDDELQDKIKNSKIIAYPNPVTDYLNLEWTENPDISPELLQLFSVDSKLIYRKKITQKYGRLEVPVHNYPSGMYILVVSYKGGKNESFKIIKN